MIIVLGSAHDPVARSMIDTFTDAHLCSAEDLCSPGWVWPIDHMRDPVWVVEGRPVPDETVSGVFVRRTCVYPEELMGTHPDDREYLAAECSAFLSFVLARTGARVVNPVIDGAFGEEALRLERWMPAARSVGQAVAPLRFHDGEVEEIARSAIVVDVVDGEAFGDLDVALLQRLALMARKIGVDYGNFVVDPADRLLSVSTAAAPGDRAAARLGRLLEKRAAP